MSASRTVLVTTRLFDASATQTLRARGFEVLTGGQADGMSDGTISSAMHADLQKSGAWIVGAAPVTRALLERYPHLQIVARRGVGYDAVDPVAIQELGRVLTITPGCNESSVADHTVGMMLAAGKHFVASHRRMADGANGVIVGTELYGKTVGLIGVGCIAQLVMRRLRGFDVRILAYAPSLTADKASQLGVEAVSLEQLLQQSDFVSLHAPLNAATRHMINAKTLAMMKPGAVLVNTSRGQLVDDHALLDALRSGKLAGAGLDVLGSERDPSLEPITRALLALPNTVCTPHTAGSSHEALTRANALAVECVTAALEGREIPRACVVADGRNA